jgi:surfeit locus 1 family protein
MTRPEFSERPRPRLLSAVLVLIGIGLLVGLGVWQLQRLKWKENLLARIAALQSAAAIPLEGALRAGGDLDYVRVTFDCPDLERRPTLRLFSLHEGVAGYRLIAACPIVSDHASSILVDRGFVPLEQPGAGAGRAVLPGPVVGVMRQGDRRNFVTPPNDPVQNLWYSRDVPAMARQLRAPAPAPAFVMVERPAPAGAGPIPAPLPTDIPNRHLEYAITWFGLAAALVAVYVARLFGKRPD